jgi:predicted permease
MEDSKVFSQIIVLFLIMIVGYFCGTKKIITREVHRGLSELLLDVTIPFMIVASFNYDFSWEMLKRAGVLLFYSFVMYFGLIFLSKVLYFKYPPSTKGVLKFISVFSNCGYMGYPVIESIYGKIGIFYASIFNIPFNILAYTLGEMLFTGNKDFKALKKSLVNPGNAAICIGLFLFIFSIKLPYPIQEALDTIGGTTTPLSMLIVGSMLAEMEVKELFKGFELYYGSIIRLIATPLLVYSFLKLIGVSGMDLGIPVLIAAMPAAANSVIFATRYGGDSEFASKMIFITTVLSVVTIPLILLLL